MKRIIKYSMFLLIVASLMTAVSCASMRTAHIEKSTQLLEHDAENGLGNLNRFTDINVYRSGSYLRVEPKDVLNHVDFNEFSDNFIVNQSINNAALSVVVDENTKNNVTVNSDKDNNYLKIESFGGNSCIDLKNDLEAQDFIAEISIRPVNLCGQVKLFTIIDAEGNEMCPLVLNANGSICQKPDSKMCIDWLRKNIWSTISLRVHPQTKEYDICINGREVLHGAKIDDNQFGEVKTVRVCELAAENNGCILDIDYAVLCRSSSWLGGIFSPYFK